jgi:hypothetical protein
MLFLLCLLCRVLGDLEGLLRTQDMPADHAAAYEFVLRRANVLYACGKNVSSPPRRRPQLRSGGMSGFLQARTAYPPGGMPATASFLPPADLALLTWRC